MNRLYVVESTPTLTGAFADHVIRLTPQDVASVARAIAERILDPRSQATSPNLPPQVSQRWIEAVADDLLSSRAAGGSGASMVIAGPSQPPEIHALAHAMNGALGNVGATVLYIEPVEARPIAQLDDLRALVDDMRAGRVSTLLILGGNPAFNAPSDLEFAKALANVPFRVHLGLYEDETSALCQWHVPQAHELETWSDARAYDGTATILQPLIAPLYGGKSSGELLAVVLGQVAATAHELVRQHWRTQLGEDGFEAAWQRALHDGLIPDTRSPVKSVTLRPEATESIRRAGGRHRVHVVDPLIDDSNRFQIAFRPDPTIWDGCFANNAWLQELPKPLTKLTWDSAALIAPAAAQQLDLSNGDIVRLDDGRTSIEVPVWVLPGQPERLLTLHFGNGRKIGGHVAKDSGFDVFPLRTSTAMWTLSGVALAKTGRRYLLASTQTHHSMEGRHLVRSGTLGEYAAHPEHPPFVEVGHHAPHDVSLYPPAESTGYQWGMSINLGSCIGCNACVVACQAENNIPVVGKSQVANHREMHWLRIDHYYEGPAGDPRTHHQPVLCMHCELAPCEPVCPVAATTHSSEGLNEMTYNRCVGTRYCSNNCPYKVRRFNFLSYNADKRETPVLQMLANPDVTVRSRGVMEKCTYCVQRINAARIESEKEGRSIRDGEVVTACQAACPAEAIVFGDLNDKTSLVAQKKQSPLDYALLGELNTRPRTTYLAAVRNPNPRLAGI
jgi:molybdopterin-containing oxidoreductase family iron-sulfur binding subunit